MRVRLLSSRHAFVVAALLALVACSHPDTSQLSAKGQQDLKRLQVVRAVNDVTNGAIAANRSGQLSDAAEKQILTVNKQVLDVIQADPVGYRATAIQIVKNAQDGLPEGIRAIVSEWLAKTLAALQEVQ